MKITNRFGLPESIVQAVANDPYSDEGSDITASKLADPPQIRVLMRKHRDELEEDVRDRVWALFGQAVHAIIERAEPSEIAETRLFWNVLGWRLSGALDRYKLDAGKLSDFKVTSAWTIVYGDRVVEWTRQLNTLAELIVRNGGEVRDLEIVAILRDWSESKAMQGGNYPQAQIVAIPIPLWPQDERIAYIEERIRVHQAAELGAVPRCTDGERWLQPSTWAVTKKGNKKAARVLDTEAEAQAYIDAADPKVKPLLSIEERRGEYVRCASYCPVSRFCPQWAADKPADPPTLEQQLAASVEAVEARS